MRKVADAFLRRISRNIRPNLTVTRTAVTFQVLWWFAVLSPSLENVLVEIDLLLLSIFLFVVQTARRMKGTHFNWHKELFRLSPAFALMALDFIFISTGAYETPKGWLWLASIWFIFLSLGQPTLEALLEKCPRALGALVVGLGGPLSYAIGPKLGILHIIGYPSLFGSAAAQAQWGILALSWAVWAVLCKSVLTKRQMDQAKAVI